MRLEEKLCHLVTPSGSERVGYLAVEAGISGEGWQAGEVRLGNQEWHRISPHRRNTSSTEQFVGLAQIQTDVTGTRTEFASTRLRLRPPPEDAYETAPGMWRDPPTDWRGGHGASCV